MADGYGMAGGFSREDKLRAEREVEEIRRQTLPPSMREDASEFADGRINQGMGKITVLLSELDEVTGLLERRIAPILCKPSPEAGMKADDGFGDKADFDNRSSLSEQLEFFADRVQRRLIQTRKIIERIDI